MDDEDVGGLGLRVIVKEHQVQRLWRAVSRTMGLGLLAVYTAGCASQMAANGPPAPVKAQQPGPVGGTGAGVLGEVTTMKKEEAALETRGVTVKLLAVTDLGPEIEGMAGRQFRMRMVTFEPGAVFGPVHDHKDRPGLVYILQGTITDHRNGIATDYGPGVGWPEDRNTTHWLENRGTTTAVEISVDIVRQK